ncbi:MAG: Type 4 prepilin-like protein leader peptide-processing enzyme [Planctomycetota bacterium]
MNDPTFSIWFATWGPTVVGSLFVFLFGACVGSFLNVLAWRLPTGQSVVTPPSRCPMCGHRLSWKENFPILGWLLLRGRCKACRVPISIQYPAIEFLVAVLFTLAYINFFAPVDRGDGSFFHDASSTWWRVQGFGASWPAFTVIVMAVAGLVAMTIVDAKTMLIPVEIPTGVTIICFVGWTVQGFMPESPSLRDQMPIPVVSWTVAFACVGTFLGLGVSRWLIATGRLRPSFSDWHEYAKDAPSDEPVDYPHARREMLAELVFLLPAFAGAGVACVVAALLGYTSSESVCQPMTLLGGSMLGWIVGGALVWAIRILGTLGFGREAMGLGDVHLQAAVGAAFGWKVAILAFFVAVFIAIVWAAASFLLKRFAGFFRREMPFGPHLAAAAILFVVARGPVVVAIDAFARVLQQGVEALHGPVPGAEKTERTPPAELARPRDRR